jgi:hypothetical protein
MNVDPRPSTPRQRGTTVPALNQLYSEPPQEMAIRRRTHIISTILDYKVNILKSAI